MIIGAPAVRVKGPLAPASPEFHCTNRNRPFRFVWESKVGLPLYLVRKGLNKTGQNSVENSVIID